MNGKKYLSLEEAAQLLGMPTDQVIRLREKGELRGFADRGTWKFKSDDVEECKRRRQPDSNPDVPLMSDDEDSALEIDIRKTASASDSDVRLMMTDDVRRQLTGSSGEVDVLKPSSAKSDSDVRLVGAPPKKESDSDVKLIVPKKGSDSDVKLSDSDSDVRLASGPKSSPRLADSDSDVRLAPPADSDSDVKLLDSGKKLHKGGDSPLPMFQGSPGESVLMDDEGPLALPTDSGVRLTGDSGVALHRPTDSGILLERPGDSGINLADDAPFALLDSGIKTGKSSPKLGQPPKTMPDTDAMELGIPMLRDDEGDRTDPEVPLLFEEDEHDLMPKNFLGGAETDAETSVVMFDEDEEEATVVPTKRKGLGADESAFELEADEEGATDEEADELEVSEEVLGEDDELEDLEVFESEEEDFESGVSAAEFATVGSRMVVPVEEEWSTGAVLLTMASAVALVVGAWMAADLLHTVSAGGSPVEEGIFVRTFAGLFKS